ncbi:MAG TPA: protein kinase [Terriglobia bacterium]|nr:protein kinase [Terriglobia bacterium]
MVGRTLSHYRITAAIGKGGMGEVYRATDTRLGRDVALKFLPENFASDADRMARFQREAQVLASLNHPYIATIYGLEEAAGVRALVIELVEGPTLADRIEHGPIPLDEALPLARQIAEGLEYAHESGIVHRDLKPANVNVTPQGGVKILDFGLAKALNPQDSGLNLNQTNSPTLTVAATQAGVILGTAAYMSPEQAKGRPVDRRADIWAFGCVLFEMLAGRPAFKGETVSDTLAAVIKDEPDWAQLPASTPGPVQTIVRRCLIKDPKQRLRDVGEARIAIESALGGDAIAGAAGPSEAVQPVASRKAWLPWAALGVLGIVLAASLLSRVAGERGRLPESGIRLVVNDTPNAGGMAISPNGRVIVYARELGLFAGGRSAGDQTNTQAGLVVRPLDQFNGKPLPNTEGAQNPFFSADGAWIGYSSPQGLMKIPASGGTPQLICPAAYGAEAAWGSGDTIVFWGGESKGNLFSGLMRVPAAGGTPEVLTTADAAKGEFRDGWPAVLPDGDSVLFTANTRDGTRIDEVSLRTRQRRIIREGGAFGRYDPAGYLLFWAPPAGDLLAAPFDLKRLAFTGAAVTVLNKVFTTATRSMAFALASNGTIVYLPDFDSNLEKKVVWVDRKGQTTPVMDSVAYWVQPRLSPDGNRVLLRKLETNCELWIYDLQRRVLSRLAWQNDNHDPLWTPDGKRVVFDVPNGSVRGLVWLAADGSGSVQPLVHSLEDSVPSSWSADGRWLALMLFNRSVSQIWVLARDQGAEPQPFRQNGFNETWPSFSPDGHYLAFASDQSGRSEIDISPFPGPGAVTQVSAGGGTNPLWSRDGRELFYENQSQMMSVKIATEPSLSVGVARELFREDFKQGDRGYFGREYDISPDGKRFVMLEPVGQPSPQPDLHVVVHFSDELKHLVSAGGL